MCYLPKSKRGMASFFLFFSNFQYKTWIPNKHRGQNAFLIRFAPISQSGETHSNNLSANKELNSHLANSWRHEIDDLI